MNARWTLRLTLSALMVLPQTVGAASPAAPGGNLRSSVPAAAVPLRFSLRRVDRVRSPLDSPRAQPAPGHRAGWLPSVQVAYLTSCGGCHGVEGVSAPLAVPTLRHLTGTFLCTHQGRRYLVRLPDVAQSVLSDRMLTEVINWVAFDLGAPVAAGPEARRYTVAEVTRLRRHPFTNTGLTRYREQVLAHLAPRCTVPAGLRVYGGATYGSVSGKVPRS